VVFSQLGIRRSTTYCLSNFGSQPAMSKKHFSRKQIHCTHTVIIQKQWKTGGLEPEYLILGSGYLMIMLVLE
jgi:hypothetical protein